MIGDSSMASSRQLFADQFTADGDGYVYRKSKTGAAYAVTADEREAMLDAFATRLRCWFWGMFATMVAVAVAATTLGHRWEEVPPGTIIGTGVAVTVSVCFVLFLRIWNAPLRLLADRAPTTPAMTRDAAHRTKLRSVSWGQLGAAAAAAPLMLFEVSARTNILIGWGRIWIVFAAALFAGVGVQAFRKWRIECD